jgi:Mn2+/Fe2+ NRAMP family transporter
LKHPVVEVMAKKNEKSGRYGPGFLVTAAFIGPGTVTTCSIAGARFGFSLIYTLVFAVFAAFILQEMVGRLSLATGKGVAESLRTYSDNKSINVVMVIIILSAITIGCAAYEAGNIIGGAMGLELLTHIDKKWWSLIITVIASIVLLQGKPRFIERFLIGLVFIMSLAFIGNMIIIAPPLPKMLTGFIPSVPQGSLVIIISLIGTTVVPYNLFLHSAAVKGKWSSLKDISFLRKDLLLAIVLGGFISASIVITSSVAFYGSGKGITGASDLAMQLQPLFGKMSEWLFAVGFFAAGMSSALTAPYAAAFATSGALGWKEGLSSVRFKSTWAAVLFIGFIVSIFDLKPLSVIVFAQFTNGLILPIAAILVLLMLNRKKILGEGANNRVQNLVGLFVVAIVVIIGLWAIIRLFIK